MVANPSRPAGVAERRHDLQDLHSIGKLDEELRVVVEMMDPLRVISGKA